MTSGLYPHVLLQGDSEHLALRGITRIFHDYDKPFEAKNTLYYALQSWFSPQGQAHAALPHWTLECAFAGSIGTDKNLSEIWLKLMFPIASSERWLQLVDEDGEPRGYLAFVGNCQHIMFPPGSPVVMDGGENTTFPGSMYDLHIDADRPWALTPRHLPTKTTTAFKLPEGVSLRTDLGGGVEFTADGFSYRSQS